MKTRSLKTKTDNQNKPEPQRVLIGEVPHHSNGGLIISAPVFDKSNREHVAATTRWRQTATSLVLEEMVAIPFGEEGKTKLVWSEVPCVTDVPDNT